jgi:NADH dehydrogenase
MRTLMITGAGGYIGRHLAAAARSAGWRVVAATRKPITGVDAWIPYRLEDDIAADAIPQGAIIVHLAAQTGARIDADIEIEAGARLAAVAGQRDARMVFVSSQTARPDAPTPYGRTKWAIEQRVVHGGGVVVRPGLVYGGSPGGVYASLLRLLRRHRVLPSLTPAPHVQPIHVEDLARVLMRVGEQADISQPVWRVAAPESMTFDDFLRAVAASRGYAPPRFVRSPAFVAPLGAGFLEAIGACGLAMRIRSLVGLPTMEVDDLATLDMKLRSLAQGLARLHPQRHAVIAEGNAMLRYVLGRRPRVGVLRRYVRGIETLRDGCAIALPAWTRRWPTTLRALDQPSWVRHWPELDWRIAAAAHIAEASPQGAERFLLVARRVRPSAVAVRLVAVGTLEVLARVGGWPLRALVRPPVDG